MQTTENLGLRKPEANDFYSVEDMNYNSDVLDAKLKEIEDASDPKALEQHTNNKENPHVVTKEQVGLGNVPNVATNDQTPTYTVPSDLTELSSGEKLGVALGKIAKAVKKILDIISGTQQVGNAKTLDGHGTGDFLQKSGGTVNGSIAASNGSNAVAIKVDRTQSDGTVSSTRMWTGTDKSALFALYDATNGTEVTRLELREGSVKARVNNTSVEMVHSENIKTLVKPSEIGASKKEHDHAASDVTSGTLGGKVQANATAMATLTNAQLRDAVVLDSDPGEGATVSYNPGTIVWSK